MILAFIILYGIGVVGLALCKPDEPKPIITERISPTGERYIVVHYPEPHTVIGPSDEYATRYY